jgi:hypothetical protein
VQQEVRKWVVKMRNISIFWGAGSNEILCNGIDENFCSIKTGGLSMGRLCCWYNDLFYNALPTADVT